MAKRFFKISAIRELIKVVLTFAILYGTTIFLVSEPLGDAAERYLVKIASPAIADLTYHGHYVPFIKNEFFSNRPVDSYANVVSVTIDDGSLSSEGASYPLAFEQYANHLELIALRKPKAIFVDIWLHDDRKYDQSMSELTSTICSLANPSAESNREPIKIYLLSFRPFGRLLHPGLQKFSKQEKSSAEQYCFTEVSAVVPLKEAEQQGWYYPFKTCLNNDCSLNKPNECEDCIPSAAVAIYNDVLALNETQKIPEQVFGNFQLIWPNRTPDQHSLHDFFSTVYENQVELDRECIEKKHILHFLSYFLPDVLDLPFLSSNQRLCEPFIKINTHELQLARQSRYRETAGQFVNRQINDSIVVYGYDLFGINDYVESPLYGSTLGLNFHATAIHNLDRIGNGVIRESKYESFVADFNTKENWFFLALSAFGAIIFLFGEKIKWSIFVPWIPSFIVRFCLKFQQFKQWLGMNYKTSSFHKGRRKQIGAKFHKAFSAVFNVLFALGIFCFLVVVFIGLNAFFFRLDYTVLVEGVFFVMALSSIKYIDYLVDFFILLFDCVVMYFRVLNKK